MAESVTVERGVDDVNPASDALTAPATDDPRGALVIANRVGEKIVVRAALAVDGVIEYQGVVGSLLSGSRPGRAIVGADYPQARVDDMSESAPRVSVTVALRWPCAITDVCVEVRAHVADELARLTGIRPSRVDVTVAQIVSRESSSQNKSGFVDLPSPPDDPDDTQGRADDQ